MRAISLTQPYAYLAGTIKGDGWCTSLTLGLRTKDRDFAIAFSSAIFQAFGIPAPERLDERDYWLVRTSNKRHIFDGLHSYEPTSPEAIGAWLRGLFDSEGNALLRRKGVSENSWGRRVAMYSTSQETLNRAASLLDALAIRTRLSATRNSAGHKGDKTVYALEVRGGRENYTRFASLVGSSIERKRLVLDAIPGSYQLDTEYCRRGQALGVAARKARAAAGGAY